MSILVDVPAGKTFTIDGPATVRVGPNANMPTIADTAPPEPEPPPEEGTDAPTKAARQPAY